ncbi:hypothetical protein WMY93_023130 [Mugilogobius chulae]|uniref:Uncharacterized protein n=1 Tax=Mugilogobius chulae TaxID=88201 RepID=A0AAW0NFI8_9GOBI
MNAGAEAVLKQQQCDSDHGPAAESEITLSSFIDIFPSLRHSYLGGVLGHEATAASFPQSSHPYRPGPFSTPCQSVSSPHVFSVSCSSGLLPAQNSAAPPILACPSWPIWGPS